jgi:hypothetical protein
MMQIIMVGDESLSTSTYRNPQMSECSRGTLEAEGPGLLIRKPRQAGRTTFRIGQDYL